MQFVGCRCILLCFAAPSRTHCHPPPHPALALGAATMALAEAVGRALGLKYWQDVRTLFLTGSYFVLFGALWFSWKAVCGAGWLSLSAALYGASWLCLCYLSFLGSVATHNCIHCPMFHARWRN